MQHAAKVTCMGLHAQQHRATDSTGIASFDGAHFHHYAESGLAFEVFDEQRLASMFGRSAIGHLRYSTVEDDEDLPNFQPMMGRTHDGHEVALGHNGNLTNVEELKKQMPGVRWETSMDSEILLRRFCQAKGGNVFERLQNALEGIAGSYTLLILFQNQLIGVCDPSGNRPLYIGTRVRSTLLSSESCGIHFVEGRVDRRVEPGEMVAISQGGIKSRKLTTSVAGLAQCRFEAIYYGHPTSRIYDEHVSEFRFRIGKMLEELFPVPSATKVVPVPDSSNMIAAGFAYSGRSGQLGFGLIRNHYVGRTFIAKTQERRNALRALKFMADHTVVKGRVIVVIDDSIVRLTTLPMLMDVLWGAGALEIHVRIGSPPIIAPCLYGIDTPTEEELAAATMNVEAIRQRVSATSLSFLPLEALRTLSPNPDDFCYACFTGDRPAVLHTPL